MQDSAQHWGALAAPGLEPQWQAPGFTPTGTPAEAPTGYLQPQGPPWMLGRENASSPCFSFPFCWGQRAARDRAAPGNRGVRTMEARDGQWVPSLGPPRILEF